MVLKSFVVMYFKKAGKSHKNSTAHADQAGCMVWSYYQYMNGRSPGSEAGVDFTRDRRGVTRGLHKLYPATPLVRVPLIPKDICEIRKICESSLIMIYGHHNGKM